MNEINENANISNGFLISDPKYLHARLMFTSSRKYDGTFFTLKEVAKEMKYNYNTIKSLSRKEGWINQRDMIQMEMQKEIELILQTNANKRAIKIAKKLENLTDIVLENVTENYSQKDKEGNYKHAVSIGEMDKVVRLERVHTGKTDLNNQMEVNVNITPSNASYDELQELKRQMIIEEEQNILDVESKVSS